MCSQPWNCCWVENPHEEDGWRFLGRPEIDKGNYLFERQIGIFKESFFFKINFSPTVLLSTSPRSSLHLQALETHTFGKHDTGVVQQKVSLKPLNLFLFSFTKFSNKMTIVCWSIFKWTVHDCSSPWLISNRVKSRQSYISLSHPPLSVTYIVAFMIYIHTYIRSFLICIFDCA